MLHNFRTRCITAKIGIRHPNIFHSQSRALAYGYWYRLRLKTPEKLYEIIISDDYSWRVTDFVHWPSRRVHSAY
ncbi:hypothetical protein I308_100694 [Cryptococcus tetragattii IND107]|uniref:Uncharacterized protein n=1 Tax=Cryptococcus tetragattii IND107 TaxID=1296105 RepID=A0ABR3C5J0_9TREE